jgi:hypothetical protein
VPAVSRCAHGHRSGANVETIQPRGQLSAAPRRGQPRTRQARAVTGNSRHDSQRVPSPRGHGLLAGGRRDDSIAQARQLLDAAAGTATDPGE